MKNYLLKLSNKAIILLISLVGFVVILLLITLMLITGILMPILWFFYDVKSTPRFLGVLADGIDNIVLSIFHSFKNTL